VYGAPSPQPRFWKALVAAAILTVPLSLLVRVFVPMSDLIWFAVVALSSLVIASLVHARVTNDWRAQYHLNLGVFERRTNVAPGVRAGKKKWP
jgi:hypothetical protein